VKEIQGRASSFASAPLERCFALLSAVHRYPAWSAGLVRDVKVLEWAGEDQPSKVHAAVHVDHDHEHFDKDFELVATVDTEPLSAIHLARVPTGRSDRDRLEISWRLEALAATRIELEFHAVASFIPSFVSLDGVGERIAVAVVEGAVAAIDG
jgi:hypothetical protein